MRAEHRISVPGLGVARQAGVAIVVGLKKTGRAWWCQARRFADSQRLGFDQV